VSRFVVQISVIEEGEEVTAFDTYDAETAEEVQVMATADYPGSDLIKVFRQERMETVG
jgi:hypothetical protein